MFEQQLQRKHKNRQFKSNEPQRQSFMLVLHRSHSEKQLSTSLCFWCCSGSFEIPGKEAVLYPLTFRFCLRKSNLCTVRCLSRFLFPFVKLRAILNSRSLATELIGALRNFKFCNFWKPAAISSPELQRPVVTFQLSFKMKTTLVRTISLQFAHLFDIKLPAILNTVHWLHLLAWDPPHF